jgi:S1-C subfamily serine protease
MKLLLFILLFLNILYSSDITKKDAQSLKFLKEVSSIVNKTLPSEISDGIILKKTIALQGMFTYIIQLNKVSPGQITQQMIDTWLKPLIQDEWCKDKYISQLIIHGVNVVVRFNDKNGHYVGRLAVSLKDCKIKNTNNPKKKLSKYESKSGTGFFISKDGFLLTNNHVIDKANTIEIVYKNKQYKALVISTDKTNDIALLKINTKTTYLPIALFPKLSKGEDVISLGFPLVFFQGTELKATFGHINSLSGIDDDFRFIQLDNPTQPGNSGSPLLNQKGEVIGIVSSILNQKTTMKYANTTTQNVNYAIKIGYSLPLVRHNEVDIKLLNNPKKLTNIDIVKRYEESVVLILAK